MTDLAKTQKPKSATHRPAAASAPFTEPPKAWLEQFVALRRDLHANPELGLEETRTSALVADALSRWGYEVERGIAGTGVVGRLVRGTGRKRLGLRADMDALPIQETSGAPWASRNPGMAHACGHDGHTVMLLAAARRLAEEGRFSGALHLIFQPAEENVGGAKLMIDDGLFDRYPCDAVFAMHNLPGIPQGHLAFGEGPLSASCDDVTIRLIGRGGHCAAPQLAADPIVAAASIVMGLQTILTRNVDPQQSAVINVGAIASGQVNNVIPQEATLKVTVRTFAPEVRDLLEQRIHALAAGQAESFGIRADIEYLRSYPVLVNTSQETEFARRVGIELVGESAVTKQIEPKNGSEDFAFMLERCPGSYVIIGNGTDGEKGSTFCHHPDYDFNDDNIAVGAAFWTRLAERFLVD